MDTQELNDILVTLHDELTHGQELDDESRKRLQVLLADIRSALDLDPESTSEGKAESDSLGDRLQDAMIDFEAAHPKLSQAIGQIADGLSNLGI